MAWVWLGVAQFSLLYILFPLAVIGGAVMVPVLCLATYLVVTGSAPPPASSPVRAYYPVISRFFCVAQRLLVASLLCLACGGAGYLAEGGSGGGGSDISANAPLLLLWAVAVVLPVCALTGGALAATWMMRIRI